MKLCQLAKDGGPESRVWGFFFVEMKRLMSIVLLIFKDGTRDVYHSHAFHSVSWVLWGKLHETRVMPDESVRRTTFRPSLIPIVTTRSNVHQVRSLGTTVVISFRGPWARSWYEFDPATKFWTMLVSGRQTVRRFLLPPELT